MAVDFVEVQGFAAAVTVFNVVCGRKDAVCGVSFNVVEICCCLPATPPMKTFGTPDGSACPVVLVVVFGLVLPNDFNADVGITT